MHLSSSEHYVSLRVSLRKAFGIRSDLHSVPPLPQEIRISRGPLHFLIQHSCFQDVSPLPQKVGTFRGPIIPVCVYPFAKPTGSTPTSIVFLLFPTNSEICGGPFSCFHVPLSYTPGSTQDFRMFFLFPKTSCHPGIHFLKWISGISFLLQ